MVDLTRLSYNSRLLTVLSNSATCFALLAAFVLPSAAKDIKVGGEVGWTHAGRFADIEASVGDRLVSASASAYTASKRLSQSWRTHQDSVRNRPAFAELQLFEWEGDQQNVVAVKKRSCAFAQNGVQLAKSTDSPALVSLNYTGTFFFSSSLTDHCSAGQLFAVSVTPNNETSEDVIADHKQGRQDEFEQLIRNGTGQCLSAVPDPADSSLLTAVCYSPAMRLKPGQVEDAMYFLPNPFPEESLVGVTKQTLAIVDDTDREVPLSELYLHHIFGPSDLITGEGAEFRGGLATPPLPDPYYTVINGSKFASQMSRMVNIHVINTLGVTPADVPRCIECWCADERHKLKGEHGGGGCCSDALCPSAEPSTNIKTYHLQFTVTYRLLEPHQPVMPVVSYMMDAANGSIEYDVVKQDDQAISTLSLSGPMDALCPQASSFGLLRCLGHQHIGGKCMRLINQDTGEELCRSCPSYGSANRHVAGNEQGYLVKMSEAALGHPKQIMPGANVTIESDYDASVDHFGVMALFFLDLVDFDKSCPGPVTAFTGSAFGPDYRHYEGTAFGFYANGFAPDSGEELQAEPGATQGVDETADPKPLPRSAATTLSVIVLACSLAIFAGAGVLAWTLQKSRQQQYELLAQNEANEGMNDA